MSPLIATDAVGLAAALLSLATARALDASWPDGAAVQPKATRR
jgi:hypothetical protein